MDPGVPGSPLSPLSPLGPCPGIGVGVGSGVGVGTGSKSGIGIGVGVGFFPRSSGSSPVMGGIHKVGCPCPDPGGVSSFGGGSHRPGVEVLFATSISAPVGIYLGSVAGS